MELYDLLYDAPGFNGTAVDYDREKDPDHIAAYDLVIYIKDESHRADIEARLQTRHPEIAKKQTYSGFPVKIIAGEYGTGLKWLDLKQS